MVISSQRNHLSFAYGDHDRESGGGHGHVFPDAWATGARGRDAPALSSNLSFASQSCETLALLSPQRFRLLSLSVSVFIPVDLITSIASCSAIYIYNHLLRS